MFFQPQAGYILKYPRKVPSPVWWPVSRKVRRPARSEHWLLSRPHQVEQSKGRQRKHISLDKRELDQFGENDAPRSPKSSNNESMPGLEGLFRCPEGSEIYIVLDFETVRKISPKDTRPARIARAPQTATSPRMTSCRSRFKLVSHLTGICLASIYF